MPIFNILFKRLSQITDIETIGKIKNQKTKSELNQEFGRSNWIYKKGTAKIKLLENGQIWIAEIHFYFAVDKGKKRERVKYLLKRIYE